VFLSADLGVDTSKPMGRFYLTVVAAFAELERERHRETYAEANERAMRRGVRSGGVPIGYQRDGSGKLVPSEDADGVRRLFEMRAEGDSWATISRQLEQATGKTWGHSTMR